MGACIETVTRTSENDNDKASKYFRDPSTIVKDKEAAMRASADTEEANALILKLKQQSMDNKEKNDLLVKQKTAQADQVSDIILFLQIQLPDERLYSLGKCRVSLQYKGGKLWSF